MQARARGDHEIPERAPLRLGVGDLVQVGERDTTWPAFVFVRSDRGEGWVPDRHLSADCGPAEVVAPYDTTELAVRKGDLVTVLHRDDESGWWWCRSTAGAEGWVPVAVLDVAV